MELVSAYLINRPPFLLTDIEPRRTFPALKMNDWYLDLRATDRFKIFHKRILLNDQWYRVVIRFQQNERGTYDLNLPIPFIITESVTEDGVFFTDTKVYHGKKLGNAIAYLHNGVPAELIQMIYLELKDILVYN
ncbi:hypothetical protein [Parageobacillus galactosidasius]|uniref:Uncharacterized protein n=1 Tax=Parageobacillus galactosidasius TaxID=883812 RepID=A0A226QS79_9BACL|nr:hypothetical protein [Parageobacillus galactosidasius]OXB94884.1 hypothetical protein B9L23_08455 [Parageobacillus galactosidasius]